VSFLSPPFDRRSLVVGLILAAASLGSGCTSSESLPAAAPSNPLPDCPESPNCERISAEFDRDADSLFARTRQALRALGPSRLTAHPDTMRLTAVYRVAWLFRDDVVVAVEPQSDGSRLHVRSASRTGYSDLGVNRRRVQRLLDRLPARTTASE